jgi:hypothetical protein
VKQKGQNTTASQRKNVTGSQSCGVERKMRKKRRKKGPADYDDENSA